MARQKGDCAYNTITMVIRDKRQYAAAKRPILVFALTCTLAIISGCTNLNDKEQISATGTEIVKVPPTIEPGTTTSTTVENLDLPEEFNNSKTRTTVDGMIRSYTIVDLSLGQTAPLLFVLHGYGGNGEQMREVIETTDTLNQLPGLNPIVVYPEGTSAAWGLAQAWDAANCCLDRTSPDTDDIAFFEQMIDEISKKHNVDSKRIWIAGWSNGGMMAYRLACELSEKIDAIVVGAGAYMVDTCTPMQPVSALHIHGELDVAVPYEGGSTAGILFPSTQVSIETFAKANSCTSGESKAEQNMVTRPYICDKNTNIELVTSNTWTHTWVNEWTELLVNFLSKR